MPMNAPIKMRPTTPKMIRTIIAGDMEFTSFLLDRQGPVTNPFAGPCSVFTSVNRQDAQRDYRGRGRDFARKYRPAGKLSPRRRRRSVNDAVRSAGRRTTFLCIRSEPSRSRSRKGGSVGQRTFAF